MQHAVLQDNKRGEVNTSTADKVCKLYGQMVNCYRSEEEKVGGAEDEDWKQMLSDYEGHAKLFELNRKQNLRFITVIFKGDKRTVYKDEVKHLQM